MEGTTVFPRGYDGLNAGDESPQKVGDVCRNWVSVEYFP